MISKHGYELHMSQQDVMMCGQYGVEFNEGIHEVLQTKMRHKNM